MAAIKYKKSVGTWSSLALNDESTGHSVFNVVPKSAKPKEKYNTKTQKKKSRLSIPSKLIDGVLEFNMNVLAMHSSVDQPEYEEFWFLPQVMVWASLVYAPSCSVISSAHVQWDPVRSGRKSAIYHPILTGEIQILCRNKFTKKIWAYGSRLAYEPRGNQIKIGG